MNHRDRQICEKICDEIKLVHELISGFSAEEFLADERTVRAVCMTLINIGELVKNITQELRDEHREIPWRAIAGMRDIAAHKYQTLRNAAHKYQTLRKEDVYKTCIEDIPVFEKQLQNLIQD